MLENSKGRRKRKLEQGWGNKMEPYEVHTSPTIFLVDFSISPTNSSLPRLLFSFTVCFRLFFSTEVVEIDQVAGISVGEKRDHLLRTCFGQSTGSLRQSTVVRHSSRCTVVDEVQKKVCNAKRLQN